MKKLIFERSSDARVVKRHFCHPVVFGHAEIPCAEETEDRAGRHRGHVTPLLVEPVRVAFFRDAVADERGTRRAQGDELVGVDGDVVRVLAPE
jgi:hypothetical protein